MGSILNDYPWLFAIVIFMARICDVSLSTIRTIMVFRGYIVLAATIGFFEVLIWSLAAGKVLTNLDKWYLMAGYCAGFSTGNMLGIWLESKLAVGNALVRIISENIDIHLASSLRNEGYNLTEVQGKGLNCVPVEIALIVETRRSLPRLLKLIKEVDPNAFYTVEDIRGVHSPHLNIKRTPHHYFGFLSWIKRK